MSLYVHTIAGGLHEELHHVLGTLVRGSSAAVGEKRARPQAETREEGDCSGAEPQEGEKKAKKTEVIVIDD